MKTGGDPISSPSKTDELKAACAQLGVDPGSLLAWRVYPDRVVVVLASGRKVSVPIEQPAAEKPAAAKPVIPSRVKRK